MKPIFLTILVWLTACLNVQAGSVHIVSEDWPPFIYSEQGVIKGADKDITEYLLTQLGYTVTWELMPWRRVLLDVRTGTADAILDIVPHQDHQRTYLFTSEPLSSHHTVLFHDLRRPFLFNRLSDLDGLVIGVSPGYLYNNAAFVESDAFFREPAPSFAANLKKLLRGRLDMVAMSRPVGMYTSRALGIENQIGFHHHPLSSSDFYLAFHRAEKWQAVSEAFSLALREFKKTPRYDQILQQYQLESHGGVLSLSTP